MKEATLNDLNAGEYATVTRMNCLGAMKRRLIDMGITPGVRVKLYKVAPLGDPLELRVRGYALSLRKEDARNISVEVKAR